MSVISRVLLVMWCACVTSACTARGSVISYLSSPGSFPLVTSSLANEFGTTSFPPLSETTQSFYQVEGSGNVELTFRFKADTGAFQFNFGYYLVSPALQSIDLSTDAGKIAYATQALAPGNATLVFDDATDNPGAIEKLTVAGGTTLGFFLIPNASLAAFQAAPGDFAIDSGSIGSSPPNRWPLFGLADANPGGEDQLLSFSGTSAVTGKSTNLFAWEDLTRAPILRNPFPSDNSFHDLVFAVEGVAPVAGPGVAPVPEPASLAIFGLMGVGVAVRCRRSRPTMRSIPKH